MNTTISVICYKSKTLANGEHPLMLRIIQNRKTQYKSLNISVAAKHWDFDKSTRPSRQDDELTRKVVDAARLLDIKVADHIILTSEDFYSYNDEGRI